jgi:hypothetical protein
MPPAVNEQKRHRVGSDFGSLRAVVHAAGVSPSMAQWRDIIAVDLVGSARLLAALRPVMIDGTAIVFFASMAPLLVPGGVDPAIDAALDEPMRPDMVERLSAAAGPALTDPGFAYLWAKRGVQRLVQREAVALGAGGIRICSVSPGGGGDRGGGDACRHRVGGVGCSHCGFHPLCQRSNSVVCLFCRGFSRSNTDPSVCPELPRRRLASRTHRRGHYAGGSSRCDRTRSLPDPARRRCALHYLRRRHRDRVLAR